MSKLLSIIDEKRDHAAVEEIARQWLVRLYSDDVTKQEQQAFKDWLVADPNHVSTYKAVETMWRSIEQIDQAAFETSSNDNHQQLHHSQYTSNGMLKGLAIAACLLVAAVTTLMVTGSSPTPVSYETAIAEHRSVTFTDGTVVVLGARSKIETVITDDVRSVSLLAGTAYFDVAPDTSRPFNVRAADTSITVTGTEFDVSLRPETVQVSVTEGHVNVVDATPEQSNPRITSLIVGDQLITGRGGNIVEKRGFDADQLLSWQSGRLSYAGAELRDIVADANRYRKIPIRIRDESVASLKVTTSFGAHQSNQMLEGIALSYPVKVSHLPSAVVIRAQQK